MEIEISDELYTIIRTYALFKGVSEEYILWEMRECISNQIAKMVESIKELR
ncbi:MAG: hypothetical protein IKE59_04620 [Erysipelotrichaceae bacterium]|nr:hypothetical protein [Erysipelotrichaceae bacterium]